MNDEYIRRVEAEEAIEEYCCRRCKDYSEVEGGCVSHAQHCEHLSGEEILKPVKSADVQPVKHGRWLPSDSCITAAYGTIHCQICSECGADLMEDSDYDYDFCPVCGARMDLKDGDAE